MEEKNPFLIRKRFKPSLQIRHSHPYIAGLSLCQKIKELGFEAYFVGGIVRDFFIFPHKKPEDIDIATSAPPSLLLSLPYCKEIAFQVFSIQHKGWNFQVTPFRKEGFYTNQRHPSSVASGSWEEDCLRRDFTINSLYFDPLKKDIFTITTGFSDLKNKIIRAVGNPLLRIKEDGLRLVRGCRFASSFQFQIETETWRALEASLQETKGLSLERVIEELKKTLCLGVFSSLLLSLGLLQEWVGIEKKPSPLPRKPYELFSSSLQKQYPVSLFAYSLLQLDLSEQEKKSLFSSLLLWPLSSEDKKALILLELLENEKKEPSLIWKELRTIKYLTRHPSLPKKLLHYFLTFFKMKEVFDFMEEFSVSQLFDKEHQSWLIAQIDQYQFPKHLIGFGNLIHSYEAKRKKTLLEKGEVTAYLASLKHLYEEFEK